MNFSNIVLFTALSLTLTSCKTHHETIYPRDPIQFSQQFLLALKTGEPYKSFEDTLTNIDLVRLKSELNSPNKKLAFWINIYNSLVQLKIRKDNSSFKDQKKFFDEKEIVIGGEKLSLNQIENGILRRKTASSNSDFICTFSADKLDPRIHFTLNCGALSCPPIAFYSAENLDKELTLAEESFITGNSTYNIESNYLEISELFSWYEDDFGGLDQILGLMRKYDIVDSSITPKIRYMKYDWTLTLDNF